METQDSPYIIIGLGNPGREYRETRHNLGFMLIDRLCKAMGVSLSRMQSKALVGLGKMEGQRVVVAKPQTYINLSGQSVGGLVRFYKAPIDHLIIAHDEIDLPLGTLRIRPGGGSAGQRGMASIIQQLGTQDFARMRLGVGRPPGQMDPAAYVLERFHKSELPIVDELLDRAEAAVREFIRTGLNAAINQYNGGLQDRKDNA